MKQTDVLFEVLPGVDAAIGKIILNRPQHLNVLNVTMCAVIHEKLLEWAQTPTVKAAIIVGKGERAFCAGGDLRPIYELCQSRHYAQALDFFRQEYAMNQALYDFPKPYIAFLDGIVMGGGVGISAYGSHTIVGEQLRWAMPETKIGFFPDVGVGYHLARLPTHLGNYLALTGEPIGAVELFRMNLASVMIPASRWPEVEEMLLKTPFDGLGFPTVSDVLSKFHQGLSHTAISILPYIQQIQQYFGLPTVSQIMAALQQSDDPWCQATAKAMAGLSPLSLAVTAEHLQHCRDLQFEHVLEENLQLVDHFLRSPDFIEGIRAAIIDKDRHPHWQPATLAEVTPAMVDRYFTTQPSEL